MHATFPAKKRRRASPPPASTQRHVDVNLGSSWASLHDDVVRLVASRLLAGDLLDYVRFRAVCAPWRSATVSPSIVNTCFHPRRWMMFPEGRGLYPGHPDLGDYVRFFNLDSGAFVRVHLPLFRNHCVLDSVDGLLLLQRDEDAAVRLLHPFTGDIIELPPLTAIVPDRRTKKLRLLSACASFTAGTVTVLLVFRMISSAAIATPLDRHWTMLSWSVAANEGPFPVQGKLYFVNHYGFRKPRIFEIDHACLQDAPKLILTIPRKKLAPTHVYLVEHESEILVIGHTDEMLSDIVVYKLADLLLGKFIPVTSIGDKAIFLGRSPSEGGRTLCISSKVPTVVSNTIVYYRRPLKPHYAQYNIGSRTWSIAIDKCSLSLRRGGAGPCSLIRHILTCCANIFWNKGYLYYQYKRQTPRWKVKRKFRDEGIKWYL